MWSIRQTRRFARQYKKLQSQAAADVDQAVVGLQENPAAGERKKGDLAHYRVVKFRSGSQLYLLAYSVDEGIRLIYLEAVGPHENFYRDLKR